ncbi:MAG: DUF1573 domain-containing protein [Phycisphaerae bacterium]
MIAAIKRMTSLIVKPPVAACILAVVWATLVQVTECQVPASSSAPTATAAGTTTTAATTQAAVVTVEGNLATHDLGKVRPDSVHTVIFAVENRSATDVNIRQVRADCECISAVDPPTKLAAKSATRITARFVGPRVKEPYSSELFVLTDDPQRKMIRLRVVCQVVP